MGDAEIKGAVQQSSLVFKRINPAEVVPKPQRNERELEAEGSGMAGTLIEKALSWLPVAGQLTPLSDVNMNLLYAKPSEAVGETLALRPHLIPVASELITRA